MHAITYHNHELELAKAQRAKKKKRVKAIHVKIRSQRKDDMHQFSSKLVQEKAVIFVSDVASAKLTKTKMVKSALNASGSSLKTMLKTKSHQAGIVFMEVNEAYSTQTCSCCGTIPVSSTKGRAGLGIREWTCSDCGAVHDRDVNATRNILAVDHRRSLGQRGCQHFKKVNDSYGYLAGDLVLCYVVQALAQHLRPQACLSRYGGEEFCSHCPTPTPHMRWHWPKDWLR